MAYPTQKIWIPMDWERELPPGAIARLHYKTIGPVYITAAQIAAIESRIKRQKRFKMLSHSIPVVKGRFQLTSFFIEVEVLEPVGPAVQYAGLSGTQITAILISALVFGSLWLTQDWMEGLVTISGDIGKSAEEIIKVTGVTTLQMAAAMIGILVAIKWIK